MGGSGGGEDGESKVNMLFQYRLRERSDRALTLVSALVLALRSNAFLFTQMKVFRQSARVSVQRSKCRAMNADTSANALSEHSLNQLMENGDGINGIIIAISLRALGTRGFLFTLVLPLPCVSRNN